MCFLFILFWLREMFYVDHKWVESVPVAVRVCLHSYQFAIGNSKGQNPLPVCSVACEMSHYVSLVVQQSLCATVILETTPEPVLFPPHQIRIFKLTPRELWKKQYEACQQTFASENKHKEIPTVDIPGV